MAIEEKIPTKIIPLRPKSRAQQGWHSFLSAWGKSVQAVLPTFLITRLTLLLLTYLAGVIFSAPADTSFPLTFNTVLYSWYHWDATRYLTIATQGYLSQEYTAYFPLYPTIVHMTSAILHQDPLFIGIVLSNLAFLGALTILYRFVTIEVDQETAQRCILYITIFPTAVLYFAAYAVSLFLLFVLAALYTLRRGMWWLAGLFGALATLTDFAGILLLIVFLHEFVCISIKVACHREKRQTISQWLTPLCATLLIPLALAIYAYALKYKLADPFAFLRFEDGTSRLHFPWTTPIAALHNLVSPSLYTFTAVHCLFELLILFFLLASLIFSCIDPAHLGKGRWSLILFMALMIIYSIVLPTMPGAMPSPYDPLPAIEISALASFAAFIPLARLGKQSWFHQGYLLLSLPLFTFMAIQLISNHWNV
jgi:Gpi18-like mannosyltransferase